ncbi:hypothetical protein C7974DRAFT_300924 [Boeremia exigua]|uniref:uncharacterized protein n=1 Tax=Boeremia exigua TaxID=749465 RepID=UPI001E8D83C5|nr:uncharacterized protein C7974DRAFT_300924 [Boeremia exigua]KAH6644361.1 hypothetical protein C7974DRAFT_300924 [Boeremia exigua]
MRYALIFAGVAAAYDAYGYDGYGENQASSSTPASSTSSKIGYTTITPGYGKEPVTVTSQYQAYPTCGAAGSDGKSCDEWSEDKYVSTVINDYNSKKVTVTKVEKPITVYQTKTTITHYPTTSSVPAGGNAYPTGSYGYEDKKNSTKVWYEMYEKVHEIKYKDLGAHGLPGYGGSGLCKSCDDEQPYKVKEYKDGKWSEYDTVATYKAPTPEVKTYEKPGVYTEPAKDVTISYTMTKPSEATTTAKAGVPVTYGGVTTEFKETGVKTCAYGAYETGKDKDGKDVTSTVVKTVTVTVSTTGKYEVAKPTTTVYEHDSEVVYPTISVYKPGVYHKDAQTVTITKAGETASCEYKQTKTYPSEPKKTPTSGDDSSTPCSSTLTKPTVDTKTSSVPSYPATSSTPVYESEKIYSTSSVPTVDTKTSSVPSYPETSSAPSYPATSSTPVYESEKSSSTPCTTSTKPSVETQTTSESYPTSTPVYGNEYPPSEDKTSSVPAIPATSTPCSSSTVPAVPTSTAPAYDAYPTPSSPAPTQGSGYGYSKRAGVVERRQAAVAKRNN